MSDFRNSQAEPAAVADETAPCLALWAAVMERALDDAAALAKRVRLDPTLWKNPVFRADVRGLRRWFRSSSEEEGSFRFVCAVLDFIPENVARRALAILPVPPQQPTLRRAA